MQALFPYSLSHPFPFLFTLLVFLNHLQLKITVMSPANFPPEYDITWLEFRKSHKDFSLPFHPQNLYL